MEHISRGGPDLILLPSTYQLIVILCSQLPSLLFQAKFTQATQGVDFTFLPVLCLPHVFYMSITYIALLTIGSIRAE